MFNNYIITIGASAGGIEALRSLISKLPADFPAAVFVTLHISPHTRSYLAEIFNRVSQLEALNPQDGETIQPGKIYIAPPNRHMMIKDGVICLRHGPKINHSRPAIDPLFRSAATFYDIRVIGVLLSGLLDDGVAGLFAIKKRGGVVIVQDPEEAQFSDMPRNALRYIPVDYALPIVKIAESLIELVGRPLPNIVTYPIADNMEAEVKMSMTICDTPEDEMYKIGSPSGFTCPECHGALWEINEGETLVRYRCRVGHAYGVESLSAVLGEHVEDALWAALRALEEKANLAVRIADRAANEKKQDNISYFAQKAEHAKQHALVIRDILLSNGKDAD